MSELTGENLSLPYFFKTHTSLIVCFEKVLLIFIIVLLSIRRLELSLIKNILFKFLVLIVAAAVVFCIWFVHNLNQPALPTLPSTPVNVSQSFQVTLGTDSHVTGALSFYNLPDTRTSYIQNDDGKTLVYISADVTGWAFRLSKAGTFVSNPLKISSPDKTKRADGAIQGYRAPGLVMNVPNLGLCSFIHTEYWASKAKSFPFAAEIQISCNGGTPVTILQGTSKTALAPERASGEGQPCGIVVGTDLYLYYTDWDSDLDAIHVAKAPLEDVIDPNAWSKYNNGSFGSVGLGGESSPVVFPTTDEDHYAAMCSVSSNTYLDKYLMSYETEQGIYFATSVDGLTWEQNTLVVPFSLYRSSNVWVGYFTPLSMETGDQFVTGQTGTFFFAKKINGNTEDSLYEMPFAFS